MAEPRKAIFITGGASGIGLAVGQYFAARGWLVGIADINVAAIDAAAAQFPEGQSTRHGMDVRDRDQWAAALADFARASGGRLDVLFNNAGVGHGGPFPDVPFDNADRLIAINFTGVVNGIYAALPLLKATPGSVILNTSSASGIYGTPNLAIYSATKHAVRALTEALDVEFRHYGVAVRDLMPGFIDTPLLEQVGANSNESLRSRLAQNKIEISPVAAVAEAAWAAVHGQRLHTPVGKMAKRMALFARLFPGLLARQFRKLDELGRNQG